MTTIVVYVNEYSFTYQIDASVCPAAHDHVNCRRMSGCQILIILIDIWVSIELFGDRLLFGCCIKRDGTQKHAKIHFSLIIARFCIQFYSPAPVLNMISQWEIFFHRFSLLKGDDSIWASIHLKFQINHYFKIKV